ncbi:MAG: glycosyltransferase [Desulfobacterales bacterium]|nr:glycosyltransferase [Desulfobacterales bacterium]MBF0398190.1 glycosyltransferase [Desulfobacterales bacterium]
MNYKRPFYNEVISLLEAFLKEQKALFPKEEVIKIDLHCHDYNSDVPDEVLGRILGVSETWLTTNELIDSLNRHGCNTFTVTNHNNARSCYNLMESGIDVLTGAEFSCTVPDYKIGIHVLAYGFTQDQEDKLNDLRSDIYKFQEFTYENDIPTIWAHPFYNHSRDKMIPMEFFDKMALIFERFEVINGQRDTWQNMLVKEWLKNLTEERLNQISERVNIPPARYCRNPYKKSMSGGSDCHMGIFTGLTGTLLHVENLKENLKNFKKSELALKAIKNGYMAPYGSHNDSEKMAVAFLDYFCQIAINMRDPGLIRMFLHKGTPQDKFLAFIIANGFSEIKQHKVTLNFLELFHNCFSGNAPGFVKRFFVSRQYKPIFDQVSKLAELQRDNSKSSNTEIYKETLQFIYNQMSQIFFNRLNDKIEKISKENGLSKENISEIIASIELPTYLRSYTQNNKSNMKKGMTSINIFEFLDGLSFPFLASVIILSAFFTSAKVLYNTRPFLKKCADRLGTLKHPCRMLWLTDTFEYVNGVSMFLKSILNEIQKRDLPIDLLVCSSKLKSADHLIVIPPVSEFVFPFYEHHPIRIPNFLDIYTLFREREYDRIICSTEGPMGITSLFLKYAYSVPAYFYIHTDWIMFAQKALNFDRQYRDRLRRIVRAFYRNFDGLFVLNSDQKKWLLGKEMNFDVDKVFLTADWADICSCEFNSSKIIDELLKNVKLT